MSKSIKILLIIIVILFGSAYLIWREGYFAFPGEPRVYEQCLKQGGKVVNNKQIDYCRYYGKKFNGYYD